MCDNNMMTYEMAVVLSLDVECQNRYPMLNFVDTYLHVPTYCCRLKIVGFRSLSSVKLGITFYIISSCLYFSAFLARQYWTDVK